jgi:hypothetical protein
MIVGFGELVQQHRPAGARFPPPEYDDLHAGYPLE